MAYNKKRNTLFLYRILIKELTKSTINEDTEKVAQLKRIILESFKAGSQLGNQLELYKDLEQFRCNNSEEARDFLSLCRDFNKDSIDKRQLFNEQTKLINRINTLDKNIFNNFLDNYKLISSANIFLENKTPPSKLGKHEKVLLEFFVKKEVPTLEDVDDLTFRVFVKNFNKKYDENLTENNKKVLRTFLKSQMGLAIREDAEQIKEVLKDLTREAKEHKINDKLDYLKEGLEKIDLFVKDFTEETLKDEGNSLKTMKIFDFLETYKSEGVS